MTTKQSTARLSDAGCVASVMSDSEVLKILAQGSLDDNRSLREGMRDLFRENFNDHTCTIEPLHIAALAKLVIDNWPE